ncbi:MAG: PilZ domain-containing protein [Rhodocyclaceae bacterium]|nr:PilZ domain-containing protein [Rhodocyclaceae bacterium]
MPFIKQGGLFIPTTRPYAIGDEIFMLLTLMDEPARLPIAGTVVWITPAGAQGNKNQGIGVRFSADESGQAARNKIETILGGHLNSSRPTHTI